MTAGAVAEVLHVPGLSAYVETVEAALEEAVAWGGDAVVGVAGAETLRSGGKRLRPMLVYLSAPVGGRGGPGLVAAGCAVELIHMATLVHDDQLDRAAGRDEAGPLPAADRGRKVHEHRPQPLAAGS
jgi:geranylgeranyl pyrophosphate synthase